LLKEKVLCNLVVLYIIIILKKYLNIRKGGEKEVWQKE